MRNGTSTAAFGLLIWFSFCTKYIVGIRPVYTTSLCPGSVGPTYGDVLMYDPQQANKNKTLSWYIPDRDLDCWVTLRGQTRLSNTATYMLEFRFKSTFSVKGYNYGSTGRKPTGTNVTGTDCETAYIEIYDATDAGVVKGPPVRGPSCGTISPTSFQTSSHSMVVHLFVATVPPYLLTTTPAPTMAPTTAPTTAPPAVVEAVTDNFNTTSTTSTTTTTTTTTTLAPTTTRAPTLYEMCLRTNSCPYVKFSADFTSYLAYGCYEDGHVNDGSQIYCLTQRCIHVTLLCDWQNSNNCGDWSDQIASACRAATMPPPVFSPPNYSPIWITLAALGAAVVLYYCFWRPGWLPWRLARLRNVGPAPLMECCRVCFLRGPFSGCGCCKPATGRWRHFTNRLSQTESRFPERPADPERTRKPGLLRQFRAKACCFDDIDESGFGDGQMKGRGPFGGHWMNFAFDDGMHVRETR